MGTDGQERAAPRVRQRTLEKTERERERTGEQEKGERRKERG